MVRPRKADATGRSGKTLNVGYVKRWEPETPFVPFGLAMMRSVAFRALNYPARRLLDFLICEHLSHGGRENGNLAAPYRQIEALGMSSRDTPKAFKMLRAYGFIKRVDSHGRLDGRMGMARYRLTFLPDMSGAHPTDEWRSVTSADVAAFKGDPDLHPE